MYILKHFGVLFGTTYQSLMIYWLLVFLGEKFMPVLMSKWTLYHPKALVMMARYFIFSVWTQQRNNLIITKAFRDQKATLGRCTADLCFKGRHTVIRPHLLLEQCGEETRCITVYILFLCLGDLYNCKHMKGVTGKEIAFVLLYHISFIWTSQRIYVHWQSLAIIGCFRPRNFTQAETQRCKLWWKKKNKT